MSAGAPGAAPTDQSSDRATDRFRDAIRSAYSSAASSWGAGPTRLYGRLAEAMLARSPAPLAGRRVLDVGAGAGAVSRALTGAGAEPVRVDLADGMLRAHRSLGCPGAVGDVTRLPFRDGGLDGAAAGFCLNHLSDPAAGLREMRRVVAPGGVVLSSTFGKQPPHPAKAAVDQVAARYGFSAPPWYQRMKREVEPLLNAPEAVRAAALAAGFDPARTVVHDDVVDAGIDGPEAIAAYRLGMAHLSAFVASLDDTARSRLEADVLDALADLPPVRPRVLTLAATVP